MQGLTVPSEKRPVYAGAVKQGQHNAVGRRQGNKVELIYSALHARHRPPTTRYLEPTVQNLLRNNPSIM
jgi:hypothetical protein